jgi:tetratricopeptide (TPR) repeat protein
MSLAASAEADECPVKLAELVGPQAIATLTAHLEAAADEYWRRPALGGTPDALASTARETIPNIVRSHRSSPVRRFAGIEADAYAGPDYASSNPDVFVLPGGPRALCHMIPGVLVFLSDGSTFHYTYVASVDYNQRTITLADPWAGVSFLRRGFNQAGVAAKDVATVAGKPGLLLTFDEFAAVFRGLIDSTAGSAGFPARITFDALARIYPEIADSEAFLVWRYSRMLARLNTPDGLASIAELGDRNDLDAKPGLGRIADAAGLLLAIRTNLGFTADPRRRRLTSFAELADTPERQALLAAERQRVIDALPGLAKSMPTLLLLALLEDAALLDDRELRLAVADAALSARPQDVEFLLAKAEALLALERFEEARPVLASARQIWSSDLVTAIDVPADRVLQWFNEHSRRLHLVTFDLLHWQRARIDLLEAIADPRVVGGSTEDWLADLGNNYAPSDSYGAPVDHLEKSLWLAWRRGDHGLERGLVLAGLDHARGDTALEYHLAAAVLMHARWRRGLVGLLGEDRARVKASFLGSRLCEIVAAGEAMPRATDEVYLSRQAEIAEFCQP